MHLIELELLIQDMGVVGNNLSFLNIIQILKHLK